jgi:hypothetical protein
VHELLSPDLLAALREVAKGEEYVAISPEARRELRRRGYLHEDLKGLSLTNLGCDILANAR